MNQNMLHGWINLYKPCGMTSNDAVSIIRRKLRIKKVGHGGTLDSLACGVLPVAIGEGTKIVPFVMDQRKEYVFTVRFGEMRTTDDLDGEILETCDVFPGPQEILDKIPFFMGEQQQIPPKYSALKIGGRRASDLMREGEDVELAPRTITIYDLELLRQEDARHFTFRLECSKGFYVRSFARDIAAVLGTLGCISFLERTRVGAMKKENAILLEKLIEICHIENNISYVYSIKAVLDDIPAVLVNSEEASDLRMGRSIAWGDDSLSGDVLCLEDDLELGIATANLGRLSPKRNFVY
jgi:tRNA pseudouridine55 synthase